MFSYAYTNVNNLGIVDLFYCFMLIHTVLHGSVLLAFKVTIKITS